MMKTLKACLFLISFAAFLTAARPQSMSESSATATSQPAKMIVTALSRHENTPPPVVRRDQVQVYQGKERRPVFDWTPARDEMAGLDLSIVIDDTLDSTLGLQLKDISDFIYSLPATTRVAVGYTGNGIVSMRHDFSADHESVVSALRLPQGRTGAFSSVYISLADMIKKWPETGNRREILLVSNGIDLFRGFRESAPGLNTDLDSLVNECQRKGVVLYAIYADGAGRLLRNFYLVNNGQGCLSYLAAQTGGEAFFQGFQTPLSFGPILHHLGELLDQQYLLAFEPVPVEKPGLKSFRVVSDLPNVELMAPQRTYVISGEPPTDSFE